MSEPLQEYAAPEATGHEATDAVVASMDGLDDLPVGEHVAVFERAHEALRQALVDAADAPVPGRRAESCRLGAFGSMPSWYAAGWLVPASTPPS